MQPARAAASALTYAVGGRPPAQGFRPKGSSLGSTLDGHAGYFCHSSEARTPRTFAMLARVHYLFSCEKLRISEEVENIVILPLLLSVLYL